MYIYNVVSRRGRSFLQNMTINNILGRFFFQNYDIMRKGPGTKASISPMSDYWTNWQSVEVLDFVKNVPNVEISNLEPKKMW